MQVVLNLSHSHTRSISAQDCLLTCIHSVKINWRGILSLPRHSPLDHSQHCHCLLVIISVPFKINSYGGLLVLKQFSRFETCFSLYRNKSMEPFFIHRELCDHVPFFFWAKLENRHFLGGGLGGKLCKRAKATRGPTGQQLAPSGGVELLLCYSEFCLATWSLQSAQTQCVDDMGSSESCHHIFHTCGSTGCLVPGREPGGVPPERPSIAGCRRTQMR